MVRFAFHTCDYIANNNYMLVEKEAYKGSQKTDVQKLYSQTGERIIFEGLIFGRIRYLFQ